MALPGWKKLEQSRPVRRAKTRLRQLIGTELRVEPEVSRNTVVDADWAYDPELLDSDSIVYSLGVGDTIEFDLKLIERTAATIHAFDPTPDAETTLAASEPPANFHFHAAAAAGSDGELTLYPRVRSNGSLSETMFTVNAEARNAHLGRTVPALTIPSMASRLGHEHVDLIKMDIEGAEYEVIDSLLASPLRPEQLLIEFHHRHKGVGPKRTRRALQQLQNVGYRIFYVSENVREFSFVLTVDRSPLVLPARVETH